MNKTAFVCCVCSVIVCAEVAHADFGSAGTKVVMGDFDLDVGQDRETPPEGETTSTAGVNVGVSGAYFVAERVSVGLGVTVAHESREDDSRTALSLAVTGGYAVRLGERLHVWPHVGVTFGRTSVTLGSLEGVGVGVGASAYVPFLYEPSEHLLLGLGPIMLTTLHNSATVEGEQMEGPRLSSVGIAAMLAGWF